MKRVEALAESAPRRDLARARGLPFRLAAIDAARDAPVPWLLALIPVGALAAAGLLVLALGFVTMPAASPRIESTLDEARTLGAPSADGVDGDAPVLPVGAKYTR